MLANINGFKFMVASLPDNGNTLCTLPNFFDGAVYSANVKLPWINCVQWQANGGKKCLCCILALGVRK